MRSVFSAGLLSGVLAAKFDPFDIGVGVSAGALNLAAYLAGAAGPLRPLYEELATRPETISLARFVRGGHLVDVNRLLRQVCIGELDPACPRLVVVTTDLETGDAQYHRPEPEDLRGALHASAALPLLYRHFPEIAGRPQTDGGVADAVPVRYAVEADASRVLVVRSRPAGYRKRDTPVHWYIRRSLRHYPALHRTLRRRVAIARDVGRFIAEPPDGIAIVEVGPPPELGLTRFMRSRAAIEAGFQAGRDCAHSAIRAWETATG